MKRILMLVVAVVTLSSGFDVEAQTRATRRSAMGNGARQGAFSRLMELERRKNAWLRSTFLGR